MEEGLAADWLDEAVRRPRLLALLQQLPALPRPAMLLKPADINVPQLQHALAAAEQTGAEIYAVGKLLRRALYGSQLEEDALPHGAGSLGGNAQQLLLTCMRCRRAISATFFADKHAHDRCDPQRRAYRSRSVEAAALAFAGGGSSSYTCDLCTLHVEWPARIKLQQGAVDELWRRVISDSFVATLREQELVFDLKTTFTETVMLNGVAVGEADVTIVPT